MGKKWPQEAVSHRISKTFCDLRSPHPVFSSLFKDVFKDFRRATTVIRGGARGGCGALERRRIIIYRFSEISNALIETRGILVVPAAP
jgi:hypothetical protein